MRWDIEGIVGKTISGVVVKKNKKYGGSPPSALFLCFTDNTYYEFWIGEDMEIHPAGGLDKGGIPEVLNYMKATMEPTETVYIDSSTGKLVSQ